MALLNETGVSLKEIVSDKFKDAKRQKSHLNNQEASDGSTPKASEMGCSNCNKFQKKDMLPLFFPSSKTFVFLHASQLDAKNNIISLQSFHEKVRNKMETSSCRELSYAYLPHVGRCPSLVSRIITKGEMR